METQLYGDFLSAGSHRRVSETAAAGAQVPEERISVYGACFTDVQPALHIPPSGSLWVCLFLTMKTSFLKK